MKSKRFNIEDNMTIFNAGHYKQIPMLDLKLEYKELSSALSAAILKTAAEAQYIMGPAVGELQQKVSVYLGVKHCQAVASGTDALVISLRALAIKTKGTEYFSPSDEIITTPFTFTATGGAILRSGATPVFVDIDPATFNINPQNIDRAITPRTVGIISVHLYGRPCPMDEIMQLAAVNKLFVLEDLAQAFGASYNGKKVGSIGDVGAISFFPSKNLGAFGDGGMICTSDDELNRLVSMLHKHGGVDKYNVDYLGYNSRLDTLQAAILLVKLEHIEHFNKLRREIAAFYNKHLSSLPWLELPFADEEGHVYHQYTVRVKNDLRNFVQKYLQKNGIASAVYYPVPLHQMKVFNGRSLLPFSLDYAEAACREVLSLPLEPLFTSEELNHVVRHIRAIEMK